MLDLCFNTTYFQYRAGFYRQKHGCATGSLVSPIVANLFMEDVEQRASSTFSGTVPSHWFRYVDDTWVKIQKEIWRRSQPTLTKQIYMLNSHANMLKKEAWPSWTVKSKWKKTETLALRFTGNQSVLTHTTHYNTSWG